MLAKDRLGDQTLGVRSAYERSLMPPKYNSCTACSPGIDRHDILSPLLSQTMYATSPLKLAPNTNKNELQRSELSVNLIRQFYMDCKSKERKYEALVSLYQQSIIFCQQ